MVAIVMETPVDVDEVGDSRGLKVLSDHSSTGNHLVHLNKNFEKKFIFIECLEKICSHITGTSIEGFFRFDLIHNDNDKTF